MTNFVREKLTIVPGSRANQLLPFKGYRQRRRAKAKLQLPSHSLSQQLQVPSGPSSAASSIIKSSIKIGIRGIGGIGGISGANTRMYLPPVTQVIPEPPVAAPTKEPGYFMGQQIPREVSEDPEARVFSFGRGGED